MNRQTGCLILFFLFLSLGALAQESTGTIDISRIRLSYNLTQNVSSAFVDAGRQGSPEQMLNGKNFTEGLIHKNTIPASRVTSTLFLKFRLSNSADSVCRVYFFPRFLLQKDRSLPRGERLISKTSRGLPETSRSYWVQATEPGARRFSHLPG